MKHNRIFYAVIFLIAFFVACKEDKTEEPAVTAKYKTIKMTTDFGEIRIWLYAGTPKHQANFLKLAGEGFYDSLLFHRVVENFVIQGGDPEGTGYGGPGYTIPAEIVSSLHHVYGAVGAARLATTMESNGSQFYLVCDPNGRPGLDGNYTVFGLVFQGLQAVDSISHVATDSADRPVNDVLMKKLVIEEYSADELKSKFGFTIP